MLLSRNVLKLCLVLDVWPLKETNMLIQNKILTLIKKTNVRGENSQHHKKISDEIIIFNSKFYFLL